MTISYALKNVATQVKDDGSRSFITLTLADAPDTVFYANLEGLSSLIILLTEVTKEMSRRMVISGSSKEIQTQVGTEINRVLSFQLAPLQDQSVAVLRAQTETGPLVNLAFTADLLQLLRQRIDEAAPLVQSLSTKKH